MVGGSLRVLRLLPPLNCDIAEILLKVALKHTHTKINNQLHVLSFKCKSEYVEWNIMLSEIVNEIEWTYNALTKWICFILEIHNVFSILILLVKQFGFCIANLLNKGKKQRKFKEGGENVFCVHYHIFIEMAFVDNSKQDGAR